MSRLLQNLKNARQTSVLRAGWVGQLWILCVIVGLGLAWQQIISWPLHRSITVSVPGEGTKSVRLPSSYPAGVWCNALIRVEANGVSVPRFTSKRALMEGMVSGFFVKGRSLQLREVEPSAKDTQRSQTWVIRLPLVLSAGLALGLEAALIVLTFLLVLAGNRTVIRVLHSVKGLFGQKVACACFSLLAVTILVGAIGIRVFGLNFPFWANDTPTYFGGIAAVASGHEPTATPDRPFAYPLVIGSLLRLVPDLRMVLASHAFSTLVAAACLAMVLWWAADRVFSTPCSRWAGKIGGLLAAGILPFDEALLAREWAILGEGLVALYLGLQLVVAWLLVSRFRGWFGSLALYSCFCLLALLATFTKPNWGLAIGLVPLFWLVVVLFNPHAKGRRLFWSCAGIAVFGVLAAAALWYQSRCTRERAFHSLTYRARALICWHVPLVRVEIDRRLALEPNGASSAVLREIAATMDREMALSKITGPGAYPSLGYDADRLFFRSIPEGPLYSALRVKEQTLLCTDLFKGGLLRRPDMFFKKVAGQMLLFPAKIYKTPKISPDQVKGNVLQSTKAAENAEGLSPEIRRRYRETMVNVHEMLGAPWPSNARLALSNRMEVILNFLRLTFTGMVLLPVVLVLGIASRPTLRQRFDWGRFFPVISVGIWAMGSVLLSALSSAITQGLDVQRYVELTVSLTLFVQALSAIATAGLVSFLVNSARAGICAPGAAEHQSTRRIPEVASPF